MGLPRRSVTGHAGRPELEASGLRGHGGGWRLWPPRRVAGGALKMTQSNKRMHATRGTTDVMLSGECGRARDARR
jgi:hypothetical protein